MAASYVVVVCWNWLEWGNTTNILGPNSIVGPPTLSHSSSVANESVHMLRRLNSETLTYTYYTVDSLFWPCVPGLFLFFFVPFELLSVPPGYLERLLVTRACVSV